MARFVPLALLPILIFFVAVPFAEAQTGSPQPMQLSLPDILRLPKVRAAIYTPIRMRQGDSLSFTTLQLADGTTRQPNGSRGIQITIFAADPNGSGYTITLQDILVSSVTGSSVGSSGLGAGKVSMSDLSFDDIPPQYRFGDGSVRLMVTAVGYEISDGATQPKPSLLPKELSVSAQLDQGGVALLLPAVQRVREAAARLR